MNKSVYKKRVAIFNAYLGGHNIEYLHHIYMNAINDADIEFTFIIPDYFEERKDVCNWPVRHNIKFHFFKFDANEYLGISKSPLKKSLVLSKILRNTLKDTGLREAILLETIAFMPFLPFILSRKTRLTSIIYYLPTYHTYHGYSRKLFDKTNFYLLAKSKVFKKICLLNAQEDAPIYNNKYKTDKFCFLPDPYNPIEIAADKLSVKEELGIENELKVYIHFGSMTRRKGTLEILDAIETLGKEELADKCFIFAGKVNKNISSEFYQKVELLKNKTMILVYDTFCEYDFLGSICSIADYILIPYKNVSQSSGVCSYAAQFKVPVIGPAEGLLGKIIRSNHLGASISGLSSSKIARILVSPKEADKNFSVEGCNTYIRRNTPNEFYKVLVNA